MQQEPRYRVTKLKPRAESARSVARKCKSFLRPEHFNSSTLPSDQRIEKPLSLPNHASDIAMKNFPYKCIGKSTDRKEYKFCPVDSATILAQVKNCVARLKVFSPVGVFMIESKIMSDLRLRVADNLPTRATDLSAKIRIF